MSEQNKTREEARQEAQSEVIDESFGVSDVEKERRERIARRAFELYLSREGSFGDEQTDWFRAEAEIRAALGSPEQDRPTLSEAVEGQQATTASGNSKSNSSD